MEIIDVLKLSGLTEKQASVYLALLELGTASVQLIAKKADLKRPTTYLILDELQQKGLISKVPQKKALFTAESPEKFVSDLSKKQEMVKRFLPEMLALHNAKKEKPAVQLFQGKEGVREVYNLAFHSRQLDIFCTIRDVGEVFPDVPRQLRKLTQDKQIQVREILTREPADVKHAQWMADVEMYQTRYAGSGAQFLTDNFIFDDKVCFFSYQPYLFAVLITSEGIATSLRTLFEMAWQQASTAI